MRTFLTVLAVIAGLCCWTKADNTNTNAQIDEQTKKFDARVDELWKLQNSDAPNALDKFEQGVRLLQKDNPTEANSYLLMMSAIHDREFLRDDLKARELAKEMIAGPAPEKYKLWAKGVLHRLDSLGKPLTLKFTASDGRDVDLAKMRGKVVLVAFWSTRCGPCIAELPRIKTAHEKFRAQGFEVIGISCDTDKSDLEKFVEKKEISWPQYFDGKQQSDNKFTVELGIDGIPHMFLVDKKGCLRVDNVRAKDGFEEQIAKLLAEQP